MLGNAMLQLRRLLPQAVCMFVAKSACHRHRCSNGRRRKEGTAATQARAQLDTGQSPKQFKAQAEAYRAILLKGLDKAMRDSQRDIQNLDVFERQQEIRRLRGELNMQPGDKR